MLAVFLALTLGYPGGMDIHRLFAKALEYDSRAEWSEAAQLYERCIELEPAIPESHFNLGMNLLRLGDYQRGFAECEWRLKVPKQFGIETNLPMWKGEPLDGKTICLVPQQGIGDTIQMVRYAALVKERGVKVIVGCRPELKNLIATTPGVDQAIAIGETLPQLDVICPLESLPFIFGTTEKTVPVNVPYLSTEPALTAHWRGVLNSIDGFKIGICWQGNRTFKDDAHRSFRLSEFAPIPAIKGVRLVSLQAGFGAEQINEAPFQLHCADTSLDDVAALIMSLDLVISADTAIAHLAGALGRPVWIPLAHVHDWRWIVNRNDSPWYPTMRLFRQQAPGEWQNVFCRIAQSLHEVLNG